MQSSGQSLLNKWDQLIYILVQQPSHVVVNEPAFYDLSYKPLLTRKTSIFAYILNWAENV